MPVPTYDKFIEPILRYLAEQPEGGLARDAHAAAARALELSEADMQERVPSGAQQVYKNRAGWAHDRLKRAGLSRSLRRGYWNLTNDGREYVRAHPNPLTSAEIETLAFDFTDVRLRPPPTGESLASTALTTPAASTSALASPDDRLEDALNEIRRSVVAEVLDSLSGVTPGYFEVIVLDLLHRMGYGTSRADLQRVGGVGDGGIDGVISLDKLGLEKVYVQAKRWQGAVGRPEVQGFIGALKGQRADKGVFITTSGFTSQAIEYAKSVERLVLIDGPRLAELMLDHEVGVTAKTVQIPKLDADYFDEESS